jgi:imidazolonepropionase-like amidohydrolase
MSWRNRPVVVLVATLVVLVAGYALWAFWPLIAFMRGDPVFYRSDALPQINRGAAATVILGGTLIDGNGGPPVENSAVVIRGDRIVAVGKVADVSIPPNAVVIQAEGKTVLPGLIDMHVHLIKGDDLHLFIAAGVTTVRDLGNFTDQVAGLTKRTRSGEIIGPRIFFSGESFIHEDGFAQWQRPTKDANEARAEVKRRIAAGASVIKIVADITPDLVEAIVEEAHRAQVPVTADILGNGLVTAERAVQLGVDGLEHVSGVPQSIQSDAAPTRFSEPVSRNALMAWIYADPQKEAALITLMVERGTYVVPTFVVMEYFFPLAVPYAVDPAERYVSPRLRSFWTGDDRLPSLSSASDRASESGFLVHFVAAQRFVAKLDAAGGRIVAGTDAPTPGVVPGFSLHRELELLVRAGVTPMRAIQAATKTASEFLGKSDELGTIEAGKLADIIVVDGQPHRRIGDVRQIHTVLKNGVAVTTSEVLKLAAGR